MIQAEDAIRGGHEDLIQALGGDVELSPREDGFSYIFDQVQNTDTIPRSNKGENE